MGSASKPIPFYYSANYSTDFSAPSMSTVFNRRWTSTPRSAEHLDGRQFADTFGDVEIRQIGREDHHGQRLSRENQHFHDLIRQVDDCDHLFLRSRVLLLPFAPSNFMSLALRGSLGSHGS